MLGILRAKVCTLIFCTEFRMIFITTWLLLRSRMTQRMVWTDLTINNIPLIILIIMIIGTIVIVVAAVTTTAVGPAATTMRLVRPKVAVRPTIWCWGFLTDGQPRMDGAINRVGFAPRVAQGGKHAANCQVRAAGMIVIS